MNWVTPIGNTSSDQAETCLLTGFNGNGDEVPAGSVISWDEVAGDGRTFKTPAAANQNLLAGVVQEAVGTAAYTDRIVAYGPVEARTYGVATTFVPGANLFAVTGKDYLVYESASIIQVQPRMFTAIDTHSTASTITTTVFVRGL